MFKYAFLFIKPLRIGDDVAGSWLYIEILKNKKENIHCPTIMFGSIMFTIHKSAGCVLMMVVAVVVQTTFSQLGFFYFLNDNKHHSPS
jgi:hypothetical protein